MKCKSLDRFNPTNLPLLPMGNYRVYCKSRHIGRETKNEGALSAVRHCCPVCESNATRAGGVPNGVNRCPQEGANFSFSVKSRHIGREAKNEEPFSAARHCCPVFVSVAANDNGVPIGVNPGGSHGLTVAAGAAWSVASATSGLGRASSHAVNKTQIARTAMRNLKTIAFLRNRPLIPNATVQAFPLVRLVALIIEHRT